MRAIVLREFGGPEKLVCEQVSEPSPEPGEVLIKVAAVSINRSFDIGVRSGHYSANIKFPLVLGADPSGTIVEVGPQVASLSPGERVTVKSTIPCQVCAACRAGRLADCGFSSTLGVHRWGGYAEYVCVPVENVAVIPDGLSFEEATVAARHGAAAFNFLVVRGGLKCGETALIFGAAGALGLYAVQIAKLAGAAVIAVAGSDSRVDLALRYGADYGINYRTENVVERVAALTRGSGADLAFESSSDAVLWPKAFACLKQAGRMVTAGAHAGSKVTLDTRCLYTKRLTIIGAAGVTSSDLDFALAASAAGKLKAEIDRVLPLEKAATAHRLVESQQASGKVLLNPQLG